MAPKKKKSEGDAAKGERVFKNLCGVCHSLSVSIVPTFWEYKLNWKLNQI